MLCLDDCVATTTMPQPTEITQFIFGQPISVEVDDLSFRTASQTPNFSAAVPNNKITTAATRLTRITRAGEIMRHGRRRLGSGGSGRTRGPDGGKEPPLDTLPSTSAI